jgi:hypothetical protein
MYRSRDGDAAEVLFGAKKTGSVLDPYSGLDERASSNWSICHTWNQVRAKAEVSLAD